MRCSGCGSVAPDLTTMVHSPSCKSAALFPSAPLERKPYVAPSVADARAMTAVLRIYAILRTNCDASGINWYGPQGVLRAVQLEIEKELDSATREKLAAAGFDVRGETLDAPEHDPPWMREPPTPRNTGTPQVCSCVNPPRLAIGETSCPSCGGSR